MNEKEKLFYDVASTPKGITLKVVIDAFFKQKVLVYDSKLGNKPFITNKESEIACYDAAKVDIEKYLKK